MYGNILFLLMKPPFFLGEMQFSGLTGISNPPSSTAKQLGFPLLRAHQAIELLVVCWAWQVAVPVSHLPYQDLSWQFRGKEM